MNENKQNVSCFGEKSPAHIEGGIEIRCPGPSAFKKLFLVLIQDHMPQPGMLMEVACADCAKWARANGAPGTKRFFHYYDSAGVCVNNKVTAY